MVNLLERHIVLRPEHNKTNISIPFMVSEEYDALFIRTAYTPKIVMDEALARKEIEAGVARYIPESARERFGQWRDYMPVVNFVTLSVDCEEEYIGCAHRHSPVMDHIISAEYSSAGFIRHAVTPGLWNCVLNCHAIVDDTVTYSLRVFGAYKNEELHDYVQAF